MSVDLTLIVEHLRKPSKNIVTNAITMDTKLKTIDPKHKQLEN